MRRITERVVVFLSNLEQERGGALFVLVGAATAVVIIGMVLLRAGG